MKRAVLAIILCIVSVTGALAVGTESASAMPVTGMSSITVSDFRSITITELTKRLKSDWPDYLTRSSGLIAAALLMLLILSDVSLLTGLSYRHMEPLRAWSQHRALAIAFGISVCIHGMSLLLDKYDPYSIYQILIPFESHTGSVGARSGSSYLAFGIIAAYIATVFIFTSLFWKKTTSSGWRALHYVSYAAIILVLLHGLHLGVDLQHGPLRTLWWAASILLVVSIITIFIRAGTLRKVRHP